MGIGAFITQTRLLAAHEGRWMASLGLWVARRSHGVGEADIPVGYARAQAPTAYGLVFVFVVETVGVSFMLAAYPVAHLVMLLLDLYTVLLVLGLHAAAVTRPHVVGSGELRVRRGARLDLRIPLERIASARYDLRFPDANKSEDGVLDVAIASQTSITIELAQPVTTVSLLGQRTQVHTVRCHADEPQAAVTAIKKALPAAS
ncbi:hypothetical protein K7B10_37680 [Streptomyces flavotricini]|uniref:Integral membrane protein n=1 Tax=Streptomyces flavotricini TaxID=66888 RepID=A0ABS8EH60_9ACTN|nr:hypothetical protein [Streptomyces flavotricini]MCC0100410.1 hypothetical protein [Streptomyces flavotricini]